LKKIALLLRSGELKEELVIFKTDMNENYIKIIRKLVFDGIKKWNNWTVFTSAMVKQLSMKFGGVWNCIIFKKTLGNFCVQPKAEKYINFYISEMDIAIFQVTD